VGVIALTTLEATTTTTTATTATFVTERKFEMSFHEALSHG
jgi:hypothetical protein